MSHEFKVPWGAVQLDELRGCSCLVIAAIRSLVSLSESFNNSLATSGCLSCSNCQFFSLSTHATVYFSAYTLAVRTVSEKNGNSPQVVPIHRQNLTSTNFNFLYRGQNLPATMLSKNLPCSRLYSATNMPFSRR